MSRFFHHDAGRLGRRRKCAAGAQGQELRRPGCCPGHSVKNTIVERICSSDCQLRIHITHTRNGLNVSIAYLDFIA